MSESRKTVKQEIWYSRTTQYSVALRSWKCRHSKVLTGDKNILGLGQSFNLKNSISLKMLISLEYNSGFYQSWKRRGRWRKDDDREHNRLDQLRSQVYSSVTLLKSTSGQQHFTTAFERAQRFGDFQHKAKLNIWVMAVPITLLYPLHMCMCPKIGH